MEIFHPVGNAHVCCDPPCFSAVSTGNCNHTIGDFSLLSSLTLCWRLGVIHFFMVALWYSEAIKTNISLYYPTGRWEIRIQKAGEFGSPFTDERFEVTCKHTCAHRYMHATHICTHVTCAHTYMHT